MDQRHHLVGTQLPITDGETSQHWKGENVVHIKGYAEDNWPPRAGDTQGITYGGWFDRLRCNHSEIKCFFWARYKGGISTYKGHVCKACGTITWAYRDL